MNYRRERIYEHVWDIIPEPTIDEEECRIMQRIKKDNKDNKDKLASILSLAIIKKSRILK